MGHPGRGPLSYLRPESEIWLCAQALRRAASTHAAHLCLSKKRSTDGSVSPVSMPLPRICRGGKRQCLPAASNRCMCDGHAWTHLQVAAAVGACWLGHGLGFAHCRRAPGCQSVRLGLGPGIKAGVCRKVADVLVSAHLKASPGDTSNFEGCIN